MPTRRQKPQSEGNISCSLTGRTVRAAALALVALAAEAVGPAAFPGAEGFGTHTPGGRGGRVIEVTNLDDAGPGSFRAACEAEGPRIVVFRVAGIIDLEKAIVVRNPYITIAGQTAPGEGICLRGRIFDVSTHDAVVRFLRCRAGDVAGKEIDAINVGHGARRVVLDHCSANWGVDECLSLSGDVADVTVSWCIIGEALNRSVHKKGSHGYGTLARASGGVSFHHNLWIHNAARNPRLGDNYGKGPFPTFDIRSNVMYDYGGACTGNTQGRMKVNYVGNYVRPGPSSRARKPISVGGPSDMEFFLRGNVWDGHAAETADNAAWFDSTEGEGIRVRVVERPFDAPPVRTEGAAEALEAVLAGVGATAPVRDVVDRRLVEHVRSRGGKIIDSQNDVGGWPRYRPAEPPADSDHDGMPDEWEKARGLDPRNGKDAAKDRDGDGYTNVEEYMNGLARR